MRLLGDPAELVRSHDGHVDGRRRAHDAIDAAMTAWTASRTSDGRRRALQAAGIPAGAVLDEADSVVRSAAPRARLLPSPRAPQRRHALPPRRQRPPGRHAAGDLAGGPVVGQDNEYVYNEVLGVTDEEYEQLVAQRQAGTEYL